MRHLRMVLPAEARSVSVARRRLLDLLDTAPASTGWTDAALLALSEVVTNAVVHTGAPVSVEVWAAEHTLRVEVTDRSPHLPTQRHYAVTAGTGRGLHLLETTVDRWGSAPTEPGKVVWFEFGEPSRPEPRSDPAAPAPDADPCVTVVLLEVPLLMHWAWQEHAQSLLREYLLFALDVDPQVIDTHAEASAALSLLHEQLPVPGLPDDPDALLADTLEPGVTAGRIELRVPRSSVRHFTTLDDALTRAREAARDGSFLCPPTQPEIGELRSWLCAEVVRQAATGAQPRPWEPPTGLGEAPADTGHRDALRARHTGLLDPDAAALAANETSTIVAVTRPVLDFLGYRSEDDLVGRRVLVVIPQRYHQAHVAGTTLHSTNGRDVLLHVHVEVPVRHADGSESVVGLQVVPERLDEDHRVFVARFTLPDEPVRPDLRPPGRPD